MGRVKTEITDDSATESDDSKTDTDTENNHNIINSIKEEVDEPRSPQLDSARFLEGEKVLAYHEGRIYDSKVRKVKLQEKEWKYFVHYLGWNKNWDEWVGVDRLMEFNDENVNKQAIDNLKQGADNNTKSRRALPPKAKNSTVAIARGKKRKINSVVKEESDHLEKLVSIQIPPPLKKQLVDDCEFITNLGKLVKLPRSPSVVDILNEYMDYRIKEDGGIADSVGEIVKGLRCYFDKALSVMLLYKNEREQYLKSIGDQVSPSTVYGAEHLLRLFVKLPELLFHASIEEDTLRELQQKFTDFLKFMQKNQSSFFMSSYCIPETSIKEQDD